MSDTLTAAREALATLAHTVIEAALQAEGKVTVAVVDGALCLVVERDPSVDALYRSAAQPLARGYIAALGEVDRLTKESELRMRGIESLRGTLEHNLQRADGIEAERDALHTQVADLADTRAYSDGHAAGDRERLAHCRQDLTRALGHRADTPEDALGWEALIKSVEARARLERA